MSIHIYNNRECDRCAKLFGTNKESQWSCSRCLTDALVENSMKKQITFEDFAGKVIKEIKLMDIGDLDISFGDGTILHIGAEDYNSLSVRAEVVTVESVTLL